MITPAISVPSAVEGLRVVRPELEPLIIPITVVIIVRLFPVQRAGTAKVGRSFGPVMALWSAQSAGGMGIAAEPSSARKRIYADLGDLGYTDDGIAHVTIFCRVHAAGRRPQHAGRYPR
jgi:hypothetical protein